MFALVAIRHAVAIRIQQGARHGDIVEHETVAQTNGVVVKLIEANVETVGVPDSAGAGRGVKIHDALNIGIRCGQAPERMHLEPCGAVRADGYAIEVGAPIKGEGGGPCGSSPASYTQNVSTTFV